MNMTSFTLTKQDPFIQQLIKEVEHKLAAKWAILCLERVLPIFEEKYPNENIPRKGICILTKWIYGDVKMWEARKYCFTILELARNIEKSDKASALIVRASSHALATCHVPAHAVKAAMYVVGAIQELNKNSSSVIELMNEEREWQIIKLKELMKRTM